MVMLDARGLEVTTSSAEAASLLDRTVERLVEMRLDAFEQLKRTLEVDPDFALAHCLRGYFGMLMSTSSATGMVREALEAARIRSAAATGRERGHVAALAHWAAGDVFRAVAQWDEILAVHPHDLLALRLQHFANFWTGRAQAMRGGTASVLPAWDESLPGFGYVLSMHAFGLEETGEYWEAERAGRRGVALNREDVWGIHAVAHVLEMQGRLAEGSAWLTPPGDRWGDRAAIRGHLWWHAALFPLEQGRYDRVLAIFDEAVRPGARPFYLDLQNATALLARLEFRGVDVGHRWEALREHVTSRIDDHALLFTDLHNVMALARLGDLGGARALIASLERWAREAPCEANAIVSPLVQPLAEAIVAFYEGRPERTVELLFPLRHSLAPIGGSHAQRDVFHQLLLEAAMASGRLELARSLAAERVTTRPASVGNWQAYATVQRRLGAGAEAALALHRAEIAGRA